MPRFTALKLRWIVERTIAWISRNQRMSKDYEFLTETIELFIYAAKSGLILKDYLKLRRSSFNFYRLTDVVILSLNENFV